MLVIASSSCVATWTPLSFAMWSNGTRSRTRPLYAGWFGTKNTLHAYLAHLEDAFLVRAVPIATDSERRRMVNPRKAYPIDPGLIPAPIEYPRASRTIITLASETVHDRPAGIQILPAADWLLTVE